MSETSIIVQCGWYVWPIILAAAILGGSGLAIGFEVGERIHGVDPSNLATYFWVVAAFLIVIAKSVHVKTWPWNDFLHRRARCCSVSEWHAVTGINEQLIMAKLLHDEGKGGVGGSVLPICGPYNSIFRRRSTGEGFTIDIPMTTGTLLLSNSLCSRLSLHGAMRLCASTRGDSRIGGSLSTREARAMSTWSTRYQYIPHQEQQRSGYQDTGR